MEKKTLLQIVGAASILGVLAGVAYWFFQRD